MSLMGPLRCSGCGAMFEVVGCAAGGGACRLAALGSRRGYRCTKKDHWTAALLLETPM